MDKRSSNGLRARGAFLRFVKIWTVPSKMDIGKSQGMLNSGCFLRFVFKRGMDARSGMGNSSRRTFSGRVFNNQSVNLTSVVRFFAVAKNPPTSAGEPRVS